MAILPIIPGSEVQTTVAGTQINSSAFRNAALAKGALGAAIGNDGAQLFGQLSNYIQDARNAKTVFEADLTMRKTKDAFTASLSTNPELASDPQKWLPAYKQQTDAVREQILNQPNLAPVVKRHLTEVVGNWEQSSTTEVNTAALLRETADTKKAGIAAATYAAQNNDEEGAYKANKALFESGVIGPKELAVRNAAVPGIAAEAQADTVIAQDPIHAPERVQALEAKMNPKKFKAVQIAAGEAMNRRQSDNLKDLASQMDTSPDGTVDPKLIQQKIKTKEITATGGESLINRMAKTKLAESKDRFSDMRMDIEDHDWTTDKTPEQTKRDYMDRAAEWPSALRERTQSFIDKQISIAQKEGKTAEKPVESRMYEMMNEDRLHQGTFVPVITKTSKPWLGDAETKTVHYDGGLTDLRDLSDKEIKKAFGPGATKQSVLASEQKNFVDKRDQMRQWFEAEEQAGRKPTIDDADAYRQKIEYPDVQAAVVHSLKSQADPNREALQWLADHPDDPMASKVRKKLGL